MLDELFNDMFGKEFTESFGETLGWMREMGQRPHYFRVDVMYHPTGKPRRIDGQVAVIVTDGIELLCGFPHGGHPRIPDPLHWQRFEELRAQIEQELPQFLAAVGGPTGDGIGDGYDRAYAAYEQLLKPLRNRYFTVEAWGQTAFDDGATLADELEQLKLIWTA